MTSIPLPLGPEAWEADLALANEYGSRMSRHCFDGDIPAFHEAFATYLSMQSGVDPHGRLLLEKQIRGTGALSFRSMSTDQQHLRTESKLRWSAWMSVLPLDLQLDLLIVESSPRFPDMVDVSTLKWDQWWDVQSSSDPAAAYAASALLHPLPDAGGPSVHWGTTWSSKQDRLVSSVQSHAMQLMAWKFWDDLRDLMANSRMQARELIVDLHIHYNDKYSRGSTLAKAVQPLPFWTMGLFTGATEPAFWEVMKCFGGPDGPAAVFQEMANPGAAMPARTNPGSGRHLASCPAAEQWGKPLSWVVPHLALSPAAVASIELTRASWSQESMEVGVSPVSPARKTPSPLSRI